MYKRWLDVQTERHQGFVSFFLLLRRECPHRILRGEAVGAHDVQDGQVRQLDFPLEPWGLHPPGDHILRPHADFITWRDGNPFLGSKSYFNKG